ncbi:hypothetical protein SAMN03159407_1689 [Rhizobium sp. NFR12]|nr:hypothetical protein SAMN03159407_1689 [Rhizobium sp. NFR12]
MKSDVAFTTHTTATSRRSDSLALGRSMPRKFNVEQSRRGV